MIIPEEKHELVVPDLTKKLFYKIGEVSRITRLEPYVLRYWEKEFPFLRPRKGSSGQRIYQRKDIEAILEIRNLLYNERFTIEGVRKKLMKNYVSVEQKQNAPAAIDEETARTLRSLKGSLKQLLKTLKQNGA